MTRRDATETHHVHLQNFINDFLQSTTDDDPTQGMGLSRPPRRRRRRRRRSRRRRPGARRSRRDGADETASERADRKSARERRRRAEVGEKFEELTKALGEAERAVRGLRAAARRCF